MGFSKQMRLEREIAKLVWWIKRLDLEREAFIHNANAMNKRLVLKGYDARLERERKRFSDKAFAVLCERDRAVAKLKLLRSEAGLC